LCGILCDETVWQAQADALRSRYDVRVVSFLKQDSMEAMARHVLADAPPRFALAGHSMGGRVALEVFRQAPERVERLALLDTGFEAAVEGEAERRAVLVNQALQEGTASIAFKWGLPMLAPARRNEDDPLAKDIYGMVAHRMNGEIYAAQTRALLSRPDATPVLGTIKCPTLILCGKEDGWSPPERHEEMAKLVPHSMLRLIDASGHMSMQEQPEAVLKAMEEWLAMLA
jgi:pimeloyl-ACP methyl ester carboxylesterase